MLMQPNPIAETSRFCPSVRSCIVFSILLIFRNLRAGFSPCYYSSLFRRCFNAREAEDTLWQSLSMHGCLGEVCIEGADFGGTKPNYVRSDVVEHVWHFCRTRNGDDPRCLRRQPC